MVPMPKDEPFAIKTLMANWPERVPIVAREIGSRPAAIESSVIAGVPYQDIERPLRSHHHKRDETEVQSGSCSDLMDSDDEAALKTACRPGPAGARTEDA